jgi:hypothetical protein
VAFVDAGAELRHLCRVVLQWKWSSLVRELKPATAEAGLAGLAVLRAFEAL